MPRFQDIPRFVEDSNYCVHLTWSYLESQLQSWTEEGLNLDPDFQRAHVWNEVQQSAYVEYILQGGPSGKDIYFNSPRWPDVLKSGEEFVLVDGKQRVNAVLRFLHNEIQAFGYTFKQYTDRIHGSLQACFVVHVNGLQTRAEVLRWYLLFNSGGTPHTPEEIARVRDLLAKEPVTPIGRNNESSSRIRK